MADKALGMVAVVLGAIGAINWGPIGLSRLLGKPDWNLVQMLLGDGKLSGVVYLAVGVAGIAWLVMEFAD